MAVAYLYRKLPHTFGVGCRILSEIKYRLPHFKPQNILDFGAGLGSGSYAFADTFTNYNEIIAVEPSTTMRKLGKFLTQDLSKIHWIESLGGIININPDFQFDIVYCGYVLEEIPSAEDRSKIIDALWNCVRPNGIFIMIEPGSPMGFRFINDFREWVRKKSRKEASIVSPCPHHEVCPLSLKAEHWCNFEQTIARLPKAVFPKDNREKDFTRERYSYIVVKKGEIISNQEQAQTPSEKSFFWPRIIRPLIKRSKHALMNVCSTNGEYLRKIVAKSHGNEGGYKLTKSIKWGDLWPIPNRIPNKFRKEGVKGKRLW